METPVVNTSMEIPRPGIDDEHVLPLVLWGTNYDSQKKDRKVKQVKKRVNTSA